MKCRLVITLVIVLAVCAIAGTLAYAVGEKGPGPGHGRDLGLTEEQREALHERVLEMREAGASREEIHARIREMLQGWGIEVPERPERGDRGCREGEGHRHPRFLDQLTEEQREAIHEKVLEMREAGASPQEIHEAVREMLESYGVEVPDNWLEHRARHREIFGQLNEEQRKAVHERMRELRQAGASREEIHATIREMLEGFGIELPEPASDDTVLQEMLESGKVKSATWGEIKSEFK